MDAHCNKFVELIKRDVQLRIPIYQRKYDWKQEHCKQLFDDIITLIKNKNIQSHFIGSIVYIDKGGLYHLGSINEYLIVDGQQRITTLMLIFAAIEELAIQDNNKQLSEQVRKQCLINQFVPQNEKHLMAKLILSKPDNDIFQKIINHEIIEGISNITKNYEYLKERLVDIKTEFSLEEIYQTINNKILVVAIALERTKDNAQLIFESMNSTGMDLTPGDLIRNFLLMNVEDDLQTELYSKYWHPLERNLKGRLTEFLLDYIYMKKGITTNINPKNIYKEFKIYFYTSCSLIPIENVISELLKFSKYWLNILNADDEDVQVKSHLKRLEKIESFTYYPFLLAVYNEVKEGKISSKDFCEILQILESFILRRSVCSVPTNSLNSIFRPLFNKLDKQNLKDSLINALKEGDYNRRWPNDEEFKQTLVNSSLYYRDFCKLILEEIELFNNKECIDTQSLTIEHIMPRASGEAENLSLKWKEMLGENWEQVYAQWIHTLGNLTLTGYNSEYSDSDFEMKKNIENGFKESRLKLNQEIAKEQVWNEEAIKSRAEHLANIAIQIWKY